MSQVDKVNYLPLLFWFIILFIIFYIAILIFFIPLLHSSLKVRQLFFYKNIFNILTIYRNVTYISYFFNNIDFSFTKFFYYNYILVFNSLITILCLDRISD